MNYVDANVLIYAAVDLSEKGQKSRQLLDKEKLVTSTLSLDEVAYKTRKHSVGTMLRTIEVLSQTPNLIFEPFLIEDLYSFKEFLQCGLDPRDAIHALTAKKMKCPILYSEDRNFDSVTDFVRKTPW